MIEHRLLLLGRQRRRGDVDRLLEERTVERIGLVEDGEGPERALRQDALDRELAPLDEAFDRGSCRSRPLRIARTSLRESSASSRARAASSSAGEFARITPRLPESPSGLTTHGKRTRGSCAADAGVGARHVEEPGHRQAGRSQALARQPLVCARGRRFRRVARKAEGPRRARREDDGTVAHGKDAVNRPRARRVHDRLQRRVFLVKAHRHRGVAPRVVEAMTPIGGEDQVDPRSLGGFAKRAELIAGRRGKDQDSDIVRLIACRSWFGSVLGSSLSFLVLVSSGPRTRNERNRPRPRTETDDDATTEPTALTWVPLNNTRAR